MADNGVRGGSVLAHWGLCSVVSNYGAEDNRGGGARRKGGPSAFWPKHQAAEKDDSLVRGVQPNM
jgi:hypothetical protein